MRVLFSCLPGFGHFHPMVPLAVAMREAGHDVAFATAPRFCRNVVQPAGFVAFAAGLSPLEVQDRLAPEPAASSYAETDAASAPSVSDDVAVDIDADREARFGAAMFARVAGPAKAPDLLRVIEQWHPALVVHDVVDFGGPLAASQAGLPYAGHSLGALPPVMFWEQSELALRPLWRGRPPAAAWSSGPMFASLLLDICPPSLQVPHAREVGVARPMRPVATDTVGAAELPEWVRQLPPRPTVYVTLGTVFNNTPGLFEMLLAGLGEEPVNLVVTVGLDRDPAQLGPRPANVHVERYLPQHLLLPHCDAVVSHAGSGTTLATLAHGLPSVALPQGADQLWNARRCAELGAGLIVSNAELTPAAVRDAVRTVLHQPSYRTQAQRVQREIAAMPEPGEAVGLLEDLARRGVQPP